MKIEVETKVLKTLLKKASGITSRVSRNIPILKNVCIHAEGDSLRIEATDLDLSFRAVLKANVIESGQVTIPCKELLKVIDKSSSPMTTIETCDGCAVNISVGGMRINLSSIPAEDFPLLNFLDDVPHASYSGVHIKNGFEKTVHAARIDDAYSMAGVLIHSVNGNTRFAATDGHRSAVCNIPSDALSSTEDGIIVPVMGVQEAVKFLDKKSAVEVATDGQFLVFYSDGCALSIRLIEGEFPSYQWFIDEDRHFHLEVNTRLLLDKLKLAKGFVTDRWAHVRFVIGSGEIKLSAGNPDNGVFKDTIPISYEGEDFEIAFSIKYLIDAISNVYSDVTWFEWMDKCHGAVFKEPGNDEYIGLVMPVLV